MSFILLSLRSRYFNPRSPHGERRGRAVMHQAPTHFNPRSPHGERRRNNFAAPSLGIFQSTLPARGATAEQLCRALIRHISIHAPRTGSDDCLSQSPRAICISIHAPRTGSDSARLQSCLDAPISIHAPRTGSDCWCLRYCQMEFVFQSTLPARGATAGRVPIFSSAEISIHAPRTGSDKPSKSI